MKKYSDIKDKVKGFAFQMSEQHASSSVKEQRVAEIWAAQIQRMVCVKNQQSAYNKCAGCGSVMGFLSMPAPHPTLTFQLLLFRPYSVARHIRTERSLV